MGGYCGTGESQREHHGIQMLLFLLSAAFILLLVLVSAHALTVEVPAKQIKVARGSNATLRCNFKTDSALDGGDLVVWRKVISKVK